MDGVGPLRVSLASLLLAAWLALFLDMTLRWFPERQPPVNLTPFRSIRHDWHAGGWHFWVNFCGNLAYFVPAGALLPLARARPTSAGQAALFALAVSVPVELAQYASGRRVADVDDVILNVSGALIGHALGRAWTWVGGEPGHFQSRQ